MFDSGLLFFNAETVTTTPSVVITIDKTPAAGIGIELVTALIAGHTYGSMTATVADSDSASASFVNLATFPNVTSNATGVRYLVVQSKKKYLSLSLSVTGTAAVSGYTVTAGIVSGPAADYLVA